MDSSVSNVYFIANASKFIVLTNCTFKIQSYGKYILLCQVCNLLWSIGKENAV